MPALRPETNQPNREYVHDVVSSTKRRITVTAILPVAFLCHLSFALYLPADQVLASEPNKY